MPIKKKSFELKSNIGLKTRLKDKNSKSRFFEEIEGFFILENLNRTECFPLEFWIVGFLTLPASLCIFCTQN